MRLQTGGKVGNFFRRIGKGIKNGVKKVYHFVKDKAVPFVREKAAPVVSKVANVVGKVAQFIPHPAAQAVAAGSKTVKNVADKISGSGS